METDCAGDRESNCPTDSRVGFDYLNKNVFSANGTMLGRPASSASEGKHFFDKPRVITWCMKSAFLGVGNRRLKV